MIFLFSKAVHATTDVLVVDFASQSCFPQVNWQPAEMTDEGLHASLTEQHDRDYFRAVRTVIIPCAFVRNAHFEYDFAALRKNFYGKWISSCTQQQTL